MNTDTLAGYKKDGRGALHPIETIAEIDLLRDNFVMEVAAKAREQSKKLAAFKAELFADFDAFVDLSAEKYQTRIGGAKGNVKLMSFDGSVVVQRAFADTLVFDERLQVAKHLIDECLREWTKDSRVELRALIDNAFQVDKGGNISTGRVLGLRRLKINDEKWQRAMQAISDAVSVMSSKAYIRVYERIGNTEEFRQIPLDVASA